MSRFKSLILILYFLLIACSSQAAAKDEMVYSAYTNNEYNVIFDYPSDWQVSEPCRIDSDFYKGGVGIIFKGPSETISGIGYTMMGLTIVPSSQKGGELADINEYLERTILARGYGDYKVEAKGEILLVSGQKGYEATISYDTYRPMDLIEKRKVPVIKTWFVIQKNGYFYDLEFSASARDYKTYLPAYQKAKATFTVR